MFNHKSFATGGLFPGLVTTRSIANLGSFEVEVIIEPVVVTGGGGAVFGPIRKKDKYKITIRVSSKKKTWKYETVVNNITAKVVAKLTGITMMKPEVTIDNITVIEKTTPTIKVDKK